MKPAYNDPQSIEQRSFEIITKELDRRGALPRDPLERAVLIRVIHTTADFEFADTLFFSEQAAETGARLLHSGGVIVTDTNMALTGINKKSLTHYGGKAYCYIADEDVALLAREHGTTRAQAAVDKAARIHEGETGLIFAAGNAPTALLRIHELYSAGTLKPAFIIACPVGFVNVIESKELILNCGIPAIIARGGKGGSAVAAAIINALL